MRKRKEFNALKDFYGLTICSLLLFVLVVVAFNRQANTEWKEYQKEFKKHLAKNANPESARAFDLSVKQVWVPELNRVDRCISCHLGYDQPDLVEVPVPFKVHPNIEPHSMLKMGCTICHGGQGFALKKKDAHGEIEHWEEPLLGRKLAQKYGLGEKSILIQINCNICHRYDEETPEMDVIDTAKKLLVQNKPCRSCHIINGTGGKLAADLTFIGDKPAERFDFSQIAEKLVRDKRPLSMLSWHFEHFMDPKAVVPDSKMPSVEYSEEEAWALALLMMSWRDVNLPIMLVPKAKKEAPPSAEKKIEAEKLSPEEWGKMLFESKGCSGCHTIGGGRDAGPDLKEITKIRDIEWLKKMILDPEAMERSDPLAQKLFKEFDEVGMPTEALTDGEVMAIIKYLESFRTKKD